MIILELERQKQENLWEVTMVLEFKLAIVGMPIWKIEWIDNETMWYMLAITQKGWKCWLCTDLSVEKAAGGWYTKQVYLCLPFWFADESERLDIMVSDIHLLRDDWHSSTKINQINTPKWHKIGGL